MPNEHNTTVGERDAKNVLFQGMGGGGPGEEAQEERGGFGRLRNLKQKK